MTDIPQIALNINTSQKASFKNYYANAADKELLINLYKTASGRGERFIYFWGTKGSGRTHLLHAACNMARELNLTTFYISLQNLNTVQPSSLTNLERLQLVCIDDIHLIAKNPEWEEAFFNFFNRMQDASKRLIISSNQTPQQCGFSLPDLTSRLKSGLIFKIHPLSEKAKLEAMIRYAKSKGLKLPGSVADFIITHCPRDIGSLLSFLNKLDKASLQAKRKLTIPFVKMVLKL